MLPLRRSAALVVTYCTTCVAIEMLPVADTFDMDVQVENHPLKTGMSRSDIVVSLAAYALVLLIFFMDWVTPALVAVGLAYQAPVVFAGLKGTRRLTIQVMMLGLFGLTLGWAMDLAADSYHFSAERIENRLLSVLSLLIVGCLTLRARDNSDFARNAFRPPR